MVKNTVIADTLGHGESLPGVQRDRPVDGIRGPEHFLNFLKILLLFIIIIVGTLLRNYLRKPWKSRHFCNNYLIVLYLKKLNSIYENIYQIG